MFLNGQPDTFAWKVPDQRACRDGNHRKDTLIPAGQPDVTCVHNGRVIFLEIKTAVGKLSDKQKIFHRALAMSGAEIHTVRSVSDVKAVLF